MKTVICFHAEKPLYVVMGIDIMTTKDVFVDIHNDFRRSTLIKTAQAFFEDLS